MPTGFPLPQDLGRKSREYSDNPWCQLVYVSATRTRDFLIVSRPEKGGGRNRPWQVLEPYLAKAPPLAIPTVPVPTAPTLPDLSASSRATAQQAREARVRTLGYASWQVESVTGTAYHAGP